VRALVTGSDGFIGRHMVRALRDRGCQILALDIKHGNDALDFFRNQPAAAFDLVVHCAAVDPHRSAIDNSPLTVGAGCLELDAALFRWAATAKPGRIIYLSSSAAYPLYWQDGSTQQRLAENMLGHWQPDAIYGLVKIVGEQLADAYRAQGGTVTAVRPFSGYGEDQDDRFPFGAFRDRARRRDDPFEVWGDGSQVRDWTHVDDLCGAILAAYEHGVDGPVNLCTGRPTSFNDLARMFAAEAGYEPQIKHLTDAPRGVAYRVGDPTLLNTFYEPRVELEEGVRRALAARQ
jgi:nucleoside-diphosphate-sugar epimerase